MVEKLYNNIKTNWKQIIEIETKKDYFNNLFNFIIEQSKTNIIYPKASEVFRAFNFFDANDTKVVIVGQDPYHSPSFANGLSFAVHEGVQTPKSLQNIFKELNNDLGITRTNTTLEDWAKQGVMMLNRVLTVNKSQPNSHAGKGWELFTEKIIKYLNEENQNIVFVLWGNNAKTLSDLIDKSKHLIISSAHPSPFSAHYGFFGSKPFSKINNYLISKNKKSIEW